MYKRKICDFIQRSSKSILLLGPRQSGKSTLVNSLNPDLTINLANEKTFLDYASNPGLLENVIHAKK